jgi:DNA repair exonuclease SbcCD ATPase subunit
MALEQIPCQTCGEPFQPKRAWAKYCSPECKSQYYKKDEIARLKEEVERLRARIAELEGAYKERQQIREQLRRAVGVLNGDVNPSISLPMNPGPCA